MAPSKLRLNKNIYTYEQIKKGEYEFFSPFEERVLLFCKQWLNGQTYFSQRTSGSTGTPKLIKISRKQMLISAKQTIDFFKLKSNDIAFVCLDSSHIAGKMMLVRSFEYNLQLVIVEPSSNPLEKINTSFHFSAMVPLQFMNALSSPKSKLLSGCKAIIIGGAPLSYSLTKEISQLKYPIFSTYGMTETVSHIAIKRVSYPSDKYYTIIGDTMIKKNSADQLIIKGAVTEHKEIITNDRVQLVSPTTFKWIGRVDNVINSSGVKFQIEELEESISILFNDLNIKNRFFLAKNPDSYFGDKLVLFIENRKPTIRKNLLLILKNHLGKIKCPKEIINLPRFLETESGKINKPQLIVDHIKST